MAQYNKNDDDETRTRGRILRTEDEGGFSFATDIGPIRPCLVHNSFGKRGPIGKTVARRTKNNSKAREKVPPTSPSKDCHKG